jgi:hypothetical protein
MGNFSQPLVGTSTLQVVELRCSPHRLTSSQSSRPMLLCRWRMESSNPHEFAVTDIPRRISHHANTSIATLPMSGRRCEQQTSGSGCVVGSAACIAANYHSWWLASQTWKGKNWPFFRPPGTSQDLFVSQGQSGNSHLWWGFYILSEARIRQRPSFLLISFTRGSDSVRGSHCLSSSDYGQLRGERGRPCDHRLIPTNQQLPSTAYQLMPSCVSMDHDWYSYNEWTVLTFP